MSFAVCRMQKMKSFDLKGIQFHNQRERESHTNLDIDKTKKHLNYDFVNDGLIDYNVRVKQIIESQKIGTRKTRKDAVLINELLVTSDRKFFDELDLDEQKRFFVESFKLFSERYGENNIAYGTVHYDEKTPHMHIGVVPMRDGRLQGKNVFNRKELIWIQDEFPLHMQQLGFDLKRGEKGSTREHIETHIFKKQSMENDIEALERYREELIEAEKAVEKEIKSLKEVLPKEKEEIPFLKKEIETEVVQKLLGKSEIIEKETENYVLTPEQLKTVNKKINAAVTIKKDYERLKDADLFKENEKLEVQNSLIYKAWEKGQEENEVLRKEIGNLYSENDTLKERISVLTLEISETYKSAKEFIKDRTEGVRDFRNTFKEFADKIKEKISQARKKKGLEPERSEFEKIHKKETRREQNNDLSR